MKRYLYGLLGLAAIAAISLVSQGLAFGGEGCCGEAACNGGCGCHEGRCCPHCGCRLEPVCQPTCKTKTETVHKYCCECKDICIPGIEHLGCKGGCCGEKCGACGGQCGGCESGCCAGGCDPCKKGSGVCGDCRCTVKTVHKLMVCPEAKEHCVRACTVSWVCPKCGACGGECGGCGVGPAPAPNGNKLPPAPKVTSTSAIEIIGTAQVGF